MNKKLIALVVLSALGTWGGVSATDLTINNGFAQNDLGGTVDKGQDHFDNSDLVLTIIEDGTASGCSAAIGRRNVQYSVKSIEITANGYGVWGQDAAIETGGNSVNGNWERGESGFANHTLKATGDIAVTSEKNVAVFGADGNINIEGDKITLKSKAEGNALIATGSSNIKIIGKNKISLEAMERGAVASMQDGNASISAPIIEISATINNNKDDLYKTNTVSVADNGNLTFNADQITINVTDKRTGEHGVANAIAVNHGTLSINSENTTVNGDISATDGEFNLNGTLNFNGTNAAINNLTGESTINLFNKNQLLNVTNNGTLTIAGSGDLNDGYAGDLQGFYSDQVHVSTDETRKTTVLLKEGLYNGETSGVVGENGKLTDIKSSGASSVMHDTLDIASGSTVMLNRILMNDVHKRMGDLRNSAGMNGAWVRYDGGRLSGDHVANKFNTIQLGADMPFADNFHAGVSASYTRGDVDFTRGGSGMDAYSFAAYGTWFAPNGMYADVIARYGYVKNELTVDNNLKGDLDNNAVALSGEFGWKFDVADNFFVTPQVEATYMHIDSDKVKLGGNTASYKFDSVDSFVGRAGLAAGYTFPNQKGNVFVKASAVHEFAGDSKVTAGNGTSLKKDGEDTWAEFGVGAQYNFNKNVQAWANLERTAGADIEEDYRATVGARINF